MKTAIDVQLATRLINSGPLLLVGTRCADWFSMAPIAWSMPGSKKPPTIFLTVGTHHATWDNMVKKGVFSCNVVSPSLIRAVAFLGAHSGKNMDKMTALGLPYSLGPLLEMPLLNDAPAAFECEVLTLDPKTSLVQGVIVSAFADSRWFQERWLVERGFAPVHHLGGDAYQVGAEVVRQPLLQDPPDLREDLSVS
ncbi:flavin reductase family protein [Myxococcota bacterium]|nr:flavin reductase family protein [Myxococcota bacterium]MBU1536553.1 flavin reductase family protein [Myxococcota bacterium]